jgi:hypothetical protein
VKGKTLCRGRRRHAPVFHVYGEPRGGSGVERCAAMMRIMGTMIGARSSVSPGTVDDANRGHARPSVCRVSGTVPTGRAAGGGGAAARRTRDVPDPGKGPETSPACSQNTLWQPRAYEKGYYGDRQPQVATFRDPT